MGDDNDGESETVKTPMVLKVKMMTALWKDNGDEVRCGDHVLAQYERVPIVLSTKSECGRTLHS